jgi:type IV pilus assembly protein PilC
MKKTKAKPFETNTFLQPRVKRADVILFCRQFSTMIDAGINITSCLEILHSQETSPRFKKILSDIRNSVQSGQNFTEALKKHPEQFDDLFVSMIAAGEAGGSLDTILQKLSAYMEKSARLKARVKGAMTYPVITMIVAVMIISVIMVFVIPVFEQMFADFGSALPLITQLVVNISRFIRDMVFFITGAGILFIFGFRRFYNSQKGRFAVDRLLLNLPVFGNMVRKVAVAGFAGTMSTMISNGVAILQALEISSKTGGNKIIESAIYNAHQDVTQGNTLHDSLTQTGFFPDMVCQMVAVGEKTGSLDVMLGKIAVFYEEQVDQALENLTSAIEPIIMVFMGILIGGLVLSMYIPIFKMAGAVGV